MMKAMEPIGPVECVGNFENTVLKLLLQADQIDYGRIRAEIHIFSKKTAVSDLFHFAEHFVELSFSKLKAKNIGYSEFLTTFTLNRIENYLVCRNINHDDSSIKHILDESNIGQIGIRNLIVLE